MKFPLVQAAALALLCPLVSGPQEIKRTGSAMRRTLLLPLFLATLFACCVEAPEPAQEVAPEPAQEVAPEPAQEEAPEPAQEEAQEDVDVVSQLRSDIGAFAARTEHTAPKVRVQHILISFSGAPRMPSTVTRTKEEAEALAADLYAQIKSGADFTQLMSENSDDDRVVGAYTMVLSGPAVRGQEYPRSGMVPAFGDTGWRLEVDEVGVAPWDRSSSPYGWHIVKRLE